MARALRINPIALRRAIYADGWLGRFRRRVHRALDSQTRRIARRAAAGEQIDIDEAEVGRWAAEMDRAKRDPTHSMVRDGFALAGREFSEPAKQLGRSPGPDQPMSIAVGEGEEFLVRADFKDVDQWVETTSLAESRTSAKKLEGIFVRASRTVKKDAEGRVRGTTPKEIAREILRTGLADNRGRADMIARTGTIWAFNEGAQQRYKAEGVTVEEWMVTADDVTCPYCNRMDGRRVRVDESFMSAGEEMTETNAAGNQQTLSAPYDVQHPPLHPRCRCTMVPVLPGLPREVVAPTEVMAEPRKKPKEILTPEGLVDLSTVTGGRKSAVHKKWTESLTANERKAIEDWTYGANRSVRAYQQGGARAVEMLGADIKTAKNLTKRMESAIERGPRVRSTLYRGLHSLSDKTYKSLVEAKEISFNAYSSAAIDRSLGVHFATASGKRIEKRILLTIKQKTAVELPETRMLREISAREFILRSGIRYRVTRSKEITSAVTVAGQKKLLNITELFLEEI